MWWVCKHGEQGERGRADVICGESVEVVVVVAVVISVAVVAGMTAVIA